MLTAVTNTAVSPIEASALPSAKRAYFPVSIFKVVLNLRQLMNNEINKMRGRSDSGFQMISPINKNYCYPDDNFA